MSGTHLPTPDDFGLAAGELRFVLVGPEWAARFEKERLRIAEALGDGALGIQHIGSTAVPGITAKPILDIAAAIRDFETGHALVPSLVALGYTYRGENGVAVLRKMAVTIRPQIHPRDTNCAPSGRWRRV